VILEFVGPAGVGKSTFKNYALRSRPRIPIQHSTIAVFRSLSLKGAAIPARPYGAIFCLLPKVMLDIIPLPEGRILQASENLNENLEQIASLILEMANAQPIALLAIKSASWALRAALLNAFLNDGSHATQFVIMDEPAGFRFSLMERASDEQLESYWSLLAPPRGVVFFDTAAQTVVDRAVRRQEFRTGSHRHRGASPSELLEQTESAQRLIEKYRAWLSTQEVPTLSINSSEPLDHQDSMFRAFLGDLH